ncbi:MAG: tellurite resistance methyltransferase TehB [Pseudomonadota bacterium]
MGRKCGTEPHRLLTIWSSIWDSIAKKVATAKKMHKLSQPHSEVSEILQYIHSGSALDLGCGRGRNSVFLRRHGFTVTSVDKSAASLAVLQETIAEEAEYSDIRASIYDAEKAAIENDYDLIVCTVVLQFLQADSVREVVRNMQRQTKFGGINLVVAPISTVEHPCPIEFPFTLEEGQLRDWYADWELCKYNENFGEFHRNDENGNRLRAKFATLVARKCDDPSCDRLPKKPAGNRP